MNVEKGSYVLGMTDEWEDFQKRNPDFVEYLPKFLDLVTEMLTIPVAPDPNHENAAGVVHLLARTCWEEMHEIVLLSGNGFGIGALKLVRSLYERAVAVVFISKNPEQAKRFMNFGAVSQRRVINQLKKAFPERVNEMMSEDDLKQVEEQYQGVVADFTEVVCKSCNTTKPAGSWSFLSTDAMALKAGYELEKLYGMAFAMPTQFIHTSMWSMKYRMLERGSDGKPTFKIGSQREESDMAAHAAHVVMLQLINALNNYFQWDKGPQLDQASADYLKCWSKPPGTYLATATYRE
jgi:hypothetical protein